MLTDKISSKTIITVIGGGPSGMAAAIFASRQGAKTVRLIEKNSILGRKLLATGNGRCNLTNTNCRELEATLRFFAELGLLTRTEAEGRVYPYSEQATSVQEALINELRNLKVEVFCNVEVQAIEKANSGFQIISGKDRFYSESVILTTGGKAGPQYGSTGDGYRFAKALGHHVVGPRPSLVQMVSDRKFFKELKGVRAKGQVKLLRGDEVVDRESGEIQFTEDGLSGICIFNLSKEYTLGDIISIDLFPDYSEETLEDMFINRKITLHSRRLAEFFDGMLHKKLIPVILTELKFD
ncbi:MAG TPA: NAD(P)/FAD-dependent oxidoreductase, partial [Anaerovoracaceae bacterium]|nr:NAD(P)/FAD-dependent oxidoreductase [Anaerovoracaceae bacterium]